MNVFELERKFPELQGVEINGIKAWPLLRVLIGFEIAKKKFGAAEEPPTDLSGKLKRIQNAFSGWRKRIMKLSHCRYIVFTNFNEKRELEGKYFDRLFHSAIDVLGADKTLVIDFCEGRVENVEKSFYKNSVNGDIISYAAIFFSRFVNLHISEADKELIGKVIGEAGVNTDYQTYFKQFFVRVRIYEWLYKIIRPKVVLTGCYTYSPQIYSAKKRKIKTIEFQHGLINSSHLGYRTELPYNKEFTADHLFSFGDDIFKSLDESVYSAESIKPAGFCYFELLENGFYNNISVPNEKYAKVICVPVDSIVENEIITMLATIAPKLPEILFVVTPRAEFSESGKQKIKGIGNIVVIKSPFQVLVQKSDYHLSIASTCAFESLYFGVPNLLFNSNNLAKSILGPVLTEKEYSFYFNSGEEIMNFLKEERRFSKTQVKEAGAGFYSDNHAAKVKTYFEQIVPQA